MKLVCKFMMKTILLLLSLILTSVCYASKNDSTDIYLADFDSVIRLAEYDYALFKFKVTDKNRKEYTRFKKGLRDDVKKGRRNASDAVACFVAWFKDAHFFIEYMNENNDHDTVYNKMIIDYSKRIDKYAPQYTHKKVDDDTYLIRFSTCMDSRADAEKAIGEYLDSGCKNLIIDIRGNGGGSDYEIMPFVNLLGTKDGKFDASIFRNTLNNIESRLNLFRIQNVLDRVQNFVKFYEKCRSTDSEYVEWAEASTHRIDSVFPLPEKAAIIIDNNVLSAAEDLLYYVEQTSNRTKRYGKENTGGAADSGNCACMMFEKYGFLVAYPTTYNSRLDEGWEFDKSGIAPHIQIPIPYPKTLTDNIDEWVLWVAKDLKMRTF